MTDLLGLDASEVTERFWEVICADEELLGLEFASIVRTGLGPRPAPHRRARLPGTIGT
ncbi:MAG: hypothetical protein M3P18_01480 [Actinomycetota bacterium]|nr:hypothetical protein [Actinomycetota bacterium]